MPPLTTAAANSQDSTPAPGAGARVALLAWAHFLNDGAANYLPGILPALLAALGLPIGYAGVLMGILIAGQALQPLTGALADRWSGRALLVLGLAGSSLGAAWVGWARTSFALIAALLLIGCMNSCFHPPALTSVRRLIPGTGEQAMSWFMFGGELGRGVWPLLASLVVVAWGLRTLWVLSLAALLTLPALWWLAPPQPRRGPMPPIRPALRRARHGLTAVVAYSSLRGVMIVGVSAFVPLLWQARGGRLVTGAALITTMLVAGLAGNFGAALLARRWGRRRLVTAASLAFCILLAAYLLAGGIWLWIAIAALGIALFITFPLTVLMGQDLLPQHPSLGGGLALGFSNALGALGAAVIGLLAAPWGPAAMLWAAEACALLALALAPLLPPG